MNLQSAGSRDNQRKYAYICDMNFETFLPLPTGWERDIKVETDEYGAHVTHVEGYPQEGEGFVDVYVGEMPEGETALDQAFANYAETVGFSDDDPADFNPIGKIKFNGKTAYGFDALCEDDTPMRFISQEVKKGVLAVIVFGAADEQALEALHQHIERNFRVK